MHLRTDSMIQQMQNLCGKSVQNHGSYQHPTNQPKGHLTAISTISLSSDGPRNVPETESIIKYCNCPEMLAGTIRWASTPVVDQAASIRVMPHRRASKRRLPRPNPRKAVLWCKQHEGGMGLLTGNLAGAAARPHPSTSARIFDDTACWRTAAFRNQHRLARACCRCSGGQIWVGMGTGRVIF